MSNPFNKIDPSAVAELSSQVRGKIILPDNPEYESERKVYNAMINKHPGMIVKCTDVADVVAAVNFGRNNNLLVAVRGGGHNAGGLGVCDEGMVIDLAGLKSVRVNTEDNTVRVGGGNTLGEVDHATHVFGLAIPAGVVSTTGVGGLTLGGGLGHLTRKYGLTVDNLLEADMVLADGSFVTVSSSNNPDLFWAIKGGGGNFGIVTSFKFQAYPVKFIYGGPTLWPIERVDEIMQWYDHFIDKAPDELGGFFALMIVPGTPFPEPLHNKKCCGIVWCYLGDQAKAEEIFKPVLDKKPVFQHLGVMPYPVLQSMFDGLLSPGLQMYWKADFFNEIGAGARAKHFEFGSKIPTTLSLMHLYPVNGAAGRVSKDATPWSYRDTKYAGVVVGVDPDPANAAKLTAWCKEYWQALHPYSAGGAYLNFIMEEGQDRIKASYGENYDRLAHIKKKYDPGNLFRVNQNILPK